MLVIGMMACMGSCKKNTTEPTTEEDFTCKHDSLIHVVAVEPTEEENGCIEHYRCAHCWITFADAQGTTPTDNTILWATNYAFDTTNFVASMQEFASDSGYLYDACGHLFVGAGAAKIYGKFLKEIIKESLDESSESLDKLFDETKKINKKLDSALVKLNMIQEKILQISEQIELNAYRADMQKRNEVQFRLTYSTKPHYRKILKVIENAGGPYATWSEATTDTIREETEIWMHTYGFDAEIEFATMLLTANGNTQSGEPYPLVYDYIASHTFPWEQEGYVFRENARLADVILITECYHMCMLYYKTHPGENNLGELNRQIRSYARILDNEKNLIYYHHDYIICQIPGARDSFEKQLIELKPYEYSNTGESLWMDNKEYVEKFVNWLNPNGFASQEWFRAVYQYYKKSESGNDYLYNLLNRIGFTNVYAGTLVAGCNCEYHEYGHYGEWYEHMLFRYSAHWYGTGNDWLGFHTNVSANGTFYYKHAITGMNMDRHSHWVSYWGSPVSEKFFTLKKKK